MKNKGGRTYRFYCDHCLKKDLDANNNIVYQSKMWIDLRDYTNHLQSKLHLKNVEKDNKEQAEYCKECDEYFSEEGYKLHEARNADMWKMKRVVRNDWACNKFKKDGKLYSSFVAMKYGTEDYKEEIITALSEASYSSEAEAEEEEKDWEPPENTGEICEECNKIEYYSSNSDSCILNDREKDYLKYNQKINNFCGCIDAEYEETIIELELT